MNCFSRSFLLLGILLFTRTLTNADAQKQLSGQDSLLVAQYKQKVAAYINPQPDSALYFIRLIKQFHRARQYNPGLADACYLQAMYHRRMQNVDSAVFYFKKSLQYAKNSDYQRGIAVAYNGLCRLYYTYGKMADAITACDECLEAAGKINDAMVIADTHLAFGNIYLREGDLRKALSHFLQVDSIHAAVPLRPDIIAAAYQGLGNVYLGLKDYDKAEEYYLLANEQFRKMPFEPTYYLYTTKRYLGEVYYYKGRYQAADSLLEQSYDFFTGIKDMRNAAEISILRGQIKAREKKWQEAESFLKEGYDLSLAYQAHETSLAALELGKLYLLTGRAAQAVRFLTEALQGKSDKDNIYIRQEAYLKLADAYAMKGDPGKALSSLKKGMALKDSLAEIQSVEKIRDLEEKYQNEKNRHQIAMLKSKNELARQRMQNQINLMLAVVAVLFTTGLYLFILYRNRKKTAEKLKQLDKVKTNFFTNISHEFRNPLTLISGYLQRLSGSRELTERERTDLAVIQRNVERLLSLVNQLLDISKIEAGMMEIVKTKNNIKVFLSSVLEGFKMPAEEKNIRFETRFINVTENEYWFDQDLVEKIVVNLVSNAIKYTPENGYIECTARIAGQAFFFEVKNSGRGLTDEEIKHVFKRFYQAGNGENSTGIGLALVRELITLYGGRIRVESKKDEWTLFGIELPLGTEEKSTLPEKALPEKPTIGRECTDDSESQTEEKLMLIAEDNAEVREYICRIFRDEYRILEADNGRKALELAVSYIPDIIISDIKMPGRDGLELCRQIRQNEKTSHIPIIMVTARAGEEDIEKGIKAGADDYIVKPFREKLLRIKVEKLIEMREMLKKRFRQEVVLNPKEIAITPVDNMFLQRLQEVLDDRLTNPDFTAEDFSRSVGMSRMQLHRKLKALTGLSATEFIRSQRLHLAASLLKNSDVNISEIGYRVGFNDVTYFIKCFKKHFHVTPGEYARNYVENPG